MPKSKLKIKGEIVKSESSQTKKKKQSSNNFRQNFIDALAGGLAELVGVDPEEQEPEEAEKD